MLFNCLSLSLGKWLNAFEWSTIDIFNFFLLSKTNNRFTKFIYFQSIDMGFCLFKNHSYKLFVPNGSFVAQRSAYNKLTTVYEKFENRPGSRLETFNESIERPLYFVQQCSFCNPYLLSSDETFLRRKKHIEVHHEHWTSVSSFHVIQSSVSKSNDSRVYTMGFFVVFSV